ncbi:AAA family ATPase [Streptomyces sp. ME02-8801-2C]|uniref:AAA family ATPase n=1 Tax=Streptomyces sp. ME02-8801-2C TaxID=3028680 RepID=UPI0029B39D60|nr:AAA family ATPase [Streptomyces sp. ME02-8801-2C]MDX3458685.1 AAA family ATPase [Streptomyces sp. ME02-8801-2C]
MLLFLRRTAELTQEELAEAAGLTARSIRDLERGRRARPQRRTVQMLVSALGLGGADAAALFAAGRSGRRPRQAPPAGDGADDGAMESGQLLDRRGQLAVLERAAGEARAGRGGVVLVRAGAGMGKTALLDTWADVQRPGEILVVSASGAELEQDFAFAVLRQLVEPLLARAGDAGRARLLAGPAQLASHALRVEGTGELPPEMSPGLLHSLYWLMVHVADEGPVALVVDDVHWADVPSVRWLEYLARRLRGLPLLLVLAGRPDSGAGAGPLLERIAGQPYCRPVDLPGLDIDSVTHLVRVSLGPCEPGFAAACASATEGNPLLLRELLRTLADNQVGAADDQAHLVEEFRGRILARTVVRRLADEPEPVLRLARALVVLGDGATWKTAAELAGLGESTARELGGRLRRIGVLASGEAASDVLTSGALTFGKSARFGHALVRAAVAEAVLGPVELAAGHARAAALLRRDGAADDLVAAHLLLAEPGGEGWWVDTLRQAARATRGRGAPEVTAAYLRRALREPVPAEERGPLLLELGKDEIQIDVGAARHHLTQASTALADPYALAEAASLLGSALFLSHEHERAVDVLARAVEELRQTDDGTGLAREVSWFLQAQMLLIGYDQLSTLSAARQHARRLWDYKLAGDTPGECMVLAALSASASTGEASAQVTNDLLDRALRGGLVAADTSQMLVTLAGLAFVATDRLDDASARFDRVADMGGRWGSLLLVSSAMTFQLLVQGRRGRQLPLTADFGHPATTADQGVEPRVRMMMATQVGESLIERCDLTSATAALTEEADFDRVGWTWQGPACLVRSRLHAARGNPAAALAVLHEYGAEENRAQVTNLTGAPWRSRAATLHLTLGQRTDALQLATEELELAHQWGTERAIGVASRCLGVIHGGRRGRALLREAVALLKRSPARLELARAHYDLGTALLRDGETDEARRTLTQALHLADTCGSALLGDQARGALTAAGVHPKPAPPTPPSLSPTEHRLVELLHAGHSDRQIAQSLLLTPHDVTALIEQAGRKLGAPSRAELATQAQAHQ